MTTAPQPQKKNKRGRKPGWTPGFTRVLTHHHGDWRWNHDNLMSKLVIPQDPDACWQWQGSQGPQGNLFGAYKRRADGEYRPQMTQANRLIARAHGHDVEGQSVFMRCGNYYCSNPRHFHILPTVGAKKRDIYV